MTTRQTIRFAGPDGEFDFEFCQMMANRIAVSHHKYGPIAENYPEKYSAFTNISERLHEYLRTKNTEFLVDAANFCMIEFMRPSVEDAFFKATDSDESPGLV